MKDCYIKGFSIMLGFVAMLPSYGAASDGATVGDSVSHAAVSDLKAAMEERSAGLWELAEAAYGNPVVNQWRLSRTLTSVGVGFSDKRHSSVPDPREGEGEYAITAGAETYTRYKSSTLWGDASYSNGKTRNTSWNETADSHLLYPYLLADSIGGNLNNETYRFRGGYADSKGKLAWGGEISYTALLQYRAVDPRPRNVTGTLDISAGVMGKVWREYMIGGALYFRKYKQTNEVEFKSEMGVDKIFHLTGMGQHYNRWAGTGLSTYYDGYRYGISLDLYPSVGEGLWIHAKGSRFRFSNILSDLNKLPMARVWHNELNCAVGWMARGKLNDWGVSGDMTVYRRHGIENIFGDAASSVYPLIGSNAMYADNAVTVGLSGMWVRKFRGGRLGVSLSPGWRRRTGAYIEPYSYKMINALDAALTVDAGIFLGRHWYLDGEIGFRISSPYGCDLNINPAGMEPGLYKAEEGAYRLESSPLGSACVKASACYLFSPRRGVRLGAGWEGVRIKGVRDTGIYMINIDFLFT